MTSEQQPEPKPDPQQPESGPDPQQLTGPTFRAPEPGSPGEQEPGSEVYRLHPAAFVIEGSRIARQALLPLVIVAIGESPLFAIIGLVLIVLISVGIGYAIWHSTTYTTSGNKLVLRTGIFAKREREVPAARVSALDTSRGLLQRIFGVVEVQVQTAGGGEKAEITLRAVTFDESERIRRDLGHALAGAGHQAATGPVGPSFAKPAQHDDDPSAPAYAAGTGTTGEPSPFPAAQPFEHAPASVAAQAAPEQTVYQMPTNHLVLAALTSPSIAVVGAALAAVASQANDLLPASLTRDLESRADDLTVTAVLVLAFGLLLVAAVVAVIGSLLLYAGFTVTRDERRIRIRRGLLTERFSTIPIDRIHGVRIVETPLRQLLGYAALEVEVAGYGSSNTEEVTRTLVPLVPRSAARATLTAIVPTLATTKPRPEDQAPMVEPPTDGFEDGQLAVHGIPTRGRRRYFGTALIFAAVPVIALAAAPIGFGRLAIALPLIAAGLWARSASRTAGWATLNRGGGDGNELLILRWRTWGRSTLIADRRRLQRAEIHTSPGQRRMQLATFHVRLSNARRTRVRQLDAVTAHQLTALAVDQRSSQYALARTNSA